MQQPVKHADRKAIGENRKGRKTDTKMEEANDRGRVRQIKKIGRNSKAQRS